MARTARLLFTRAASAVPRWLRVRPLTWLAIRLPNDGAELLQFQRVVHVNHVGLGEIRPVPGLVWRAAYRGPNATHTVFVLAPLDRVVRPLGRLWNRWLRTGEEIS